MISKAPAEENNRRALDHSLSDLSYGRVGEPHKIAGQCAWCVSEKILVRSGLIVMRFRESRIPVARNLTINVVINETSRCHRLVVNTSIGVR